MSKRVVSQRKGPTPKKNWRLQLKENTKYVLYVMKRLMCHFNKNTGKKNNSSHKHTKNCGWLNSMGQKLKVL